jgi:maleate cis-trans isomerase
MIGWRGRLGILVPPGCPTVEGEIAPIMPRGVSAHFSRMVVDGPTGTLTGQEERNRSQLEHLDQTADLLAMVKPGAMVLAHTSTSYTLGRSGEAALIERMQARHQIPFMTAFSSVIAAFARLGIGRVAFGAPYAEETTLQGKAHLESYGIEVVNYGRLENVTNIYDETAERAYALARKVDVAAADAVFLSGVGLQTMSVLDILERDLGKPVISSVAALTWASLRAVKVGDPIAGYGRLLTL